ncbi:hypothetical protein PF003_g31555 [Phytophthora fragariae]|nr:hypothetical protein PF003_g31555 [Phytophthora fragariae]
MDASECKHRLAVGRVNDQRRELQVARSPMTGRNRGACTHEPPRAWSGFGKALERRGRVTIQVSPSSWRRR